MPARERTCGKLNKRIFGCYHSLLCLIDCIEPTSQRITGLDRENFLYHKGGYIFAH